MKGDIGMANYEKQVEQEAAYPIPISLYNCYRTVRHEKRYQEYYSYASLLLPHCPVTVVQRYRDGVCSLLFHLSLNFINTRARGRSRRGTLSKMASFIVDSCRDQRFSLETWDGSKNDRLGSMHTSDHRGSVLYKN